MSLYEVNNKLETNISENDKNVLKNIIYNFYHKIIETNDFNDFEKNSSEWIEHKLESYNKNPKKFLELMENHKESKLLFTSFIGFFYQHGIGCNLDKEKAVEFYLLSVNNETAKEETNNLLRKRNIIIGKYLLSLFYYKDIILDINYKLNLQRLAANGDSEAQFNLAIHYMNGIGMQKDEKKAFNLLSTSSKKGNMDAQYYLAICYMDEVGTLRNEKKALKWFLRSEIKYFKATRNKSEKKEFKRILKLAIANDSTAQNNIGNSYIDGEGICKNNKKAFNWYTKSAKAGNAIGQYNLGYCYSNGVGTDKDEKKAFEWHTKSANNGYALAQNRLGYYYENGIGTEKDGFKAFEWYTKSAKTGCTIGQCYLGYCYENGIGTEKDGIKAFGWYKKSANAGCKIGQCYLGYCYENGIGTEKDGIKAFKWYTKSANAGCANGQCNLGHCYKNGIGAYIDEKKAFEWYSKSAENGNIEAQYMLGRYYSEGIGISKDVMKAFEWYLKSAESGYAKAQYYVGKFYCDGEILYNQHPIGFFHFWSWIKDNHFAIDYNLCTIISFAKLKKNIAKLNTAANLTTEILKSIQFSTLTPHELSLVKVNNFHGRDDEDPYERLEHFETAATTNRWTGDGRIAIAAGYLKDAAHNWQTAEEKVEDYFRRFKKVLRKVNGTADPPPIPDALQVRMYLYGLNLLLIPLVSTNNPDTLNAAITHANLVETGYNYVPTKSVSLNIPVTVKENAPLPITPIAGPTTSKSDPNVDALTQQLQQMTLNYTTLSSALLAQNNKSGKERQLRKRVKIGDEMDEGGEEYIIPVISPAETTPFTIKAQKIKRKFKIKPAPIENVTEFDIVQYIKDLPCGLTIGQASSQIPKYGSTILKSVKRTRETNFISLDNDAPTTAARCQLRVDGEPISAVIDSGATTSIIAKKLMK
ncbi:Sel1 repeat family protein [Rhizophagus clarus]|uniref:Sel1 repeat family protein n=1 Tax=Rhizophagus clarus TaxID=94130 RepID=A0A8H3LFZ6_9GLOM|nr:Sel1 repeat family protein [Rhizophagus clarus]